MTVRKVEHEITVQAPAADVYRLIAEVQNWPRIFPPTIYVDHVERGADRERIRIWATANGTARNWTSLRTLDPRGLRVTFRQEVTSPPVAAMGGTWIVEPLSAAASRVRLLHDYRSVDDDLEGLAWIDDAVEHNSRTELASLKQNVELALAAEELAFSFEDTVQIQGHVEDVYDFINEAGMWAERLPHVASVRLDEDTAGIQTLEMDTRAQDGSTHTTKSYRVTFPHHRIAYKQVTLPALMTLHTGCWSFTNNDLGVAASSQHTVVLRTENIARVLGPQANIADARQYVRSALSTNSRATLDHAKHYAEGRR